MYDLILALGGFVAGLILGLVAPYWLAQLFPRPRPAVFWWELVEPDELAYHSQAGTKEEL